MAADFRPTSSTHERTRYRVFDVLIILLVAGIFIAIVFGKGGVNLMKGCVTLIFGVLLLLAGSAIL